ncbi:MAG: hypothetical protein HKN16_01365 [Saprospiraceae bacterium]|nr:hypothetical protein [Saprospiraceae bacterium]
MKKNWIQGTLLIFILGILPLGSWFYMNKGFKYQKGAMEELKDYGSLTTFMATDHLGRTFSSDDIQSSLTLINFYGDSQASLDRMDWVEKLHEQFDDRHGVYFLNIGISENSRIEEAFGTLDTSQVILIPKSEGPPFFLGRDIKMPINHSVPQVDSLQFQPIDVEDLDDFNYFVLVDSKGVIRNYYKADEPQRLKRLVEHIALTMPRKQKAKAKKVPKKI